MHWGKACACAADGAVEAAAGEPLRRRMLYLVSCWVAAENAMRCADWQEDHTRWEQTGWEESSSRSVTVRATQRNATTATPECDFMPKVQSTMPPRTAA